VDAPDGRAIWTPQGTHNCVILKWDRLNFESVAQCLLGPGGPDSYVVGRQD